MTRALLVLVLMAGGCERSRPPEPQTREALEAEVAACDREPDRGDCDRARKSLAEARREARIAAYRQAM